MFVLYLFFHHNLIVERTVTSSLYAILVGGGVIVDKEKIDELINCLDSQESVDYLLDSICDSKKIDHFHRWLDQNLLTRHEARKYTDQSDNGIRQSIRKHLLLPFFSKGEHQSKINLFLKKDAIQYGEYKRKNVLRKPEKS